MIKEILQEGYILKTKGYYKQAIEAFYKVLEIDDTSCELFLEIAECYFYLQDNERAINYIEIILDKKPTHIGSLNLLKTIFIKNNALKEAEQTAKNIYYITKSLDDLVKIFQLLNKQQHYEEIFEYKIDANSPELSYEKAYAKYHLKIYNEALEYIDKCLNETINNKFLLLKCKILLKINQFDKIYEYIDKFDYTDLNAEQLNFIGLIKQYECNFKQALKYFEKAIKLDSKNDEYYYNYASTCFKMNNLYLAKKYYNLAISLAPKKDYYHFALANLYYTEKNYKRALEELHYDFFEAKLLKAIILFDSGYIALANSEFKKLLTEQPNNELLIDYKNKIEKILKL